MAAQKRAKKGAKTKGTTARSRPSKRRARPATRKVVRAVRPKAASRPKAAPARVPSAIGCLRQHLDFTSHTMEEVRRFYTETLGFSDFVRDPQFDYLNVVTAPGASLGFMPPMPGPPEQWRPPREPALYFMVEDVDQAYRTLQARGVVFQQEPTDMPWRHRVAVLRDPEGRAVMLAQALETK